MRLEVVREGAASRPRTVERSLEPRRLLLDLPIMLPGEVEEELIDELPAPVHLQLLILLLRMREQHMQAIRCLDRRQVVIKKRISQCSMTLYP